MFGRRQEQEQSPGQWARIRVIILIFNDCEKSKEIENENENRRAMSAYANEWTSKRGWMEMAGAIIGAWAWVLDKIGQMRLTTGTGITQ